jgi:hypothetical protein
VYGSCSLYLWECSNFIWLFEHMLRLVECAGYVCFVREERIFSNGEAVCMLKLFIESTSLIIRRMISTADVTMYITRPFFSVVQRTLKRVA